MPTTTLDAQTPNAAGHTLERILANPHAIRQRNLPPGVLGLSPFVIGVRLTDGKYDWQLVCRICGWTSLPMVEKPTRRVCEACSDLADGHAHLRALARVVDGASQVGDVVIDG